MTRFSFASVAAGRLMPSPSVRMTFFEVFCSRHLKGFEKAGAISQSHVHDEIFRQKKEYYIGV